MLNRSSLRITPAMRLFWLSVLGGAVFLATAWIGFQPASGATADVSTWRPIWEIHPAFWVSLGVGLGSYLISAWIWSLRQREPAAVLFAVSGVLTLLFSFSSVFWLVEMPLPDGVFHVAATVNMLSASGFGIVMVCLFLIYPRRLPYWRPLALVVAVGFGVWTLLRTFGPLQDFADVQRITFYEMLAIVVTIIWQVVATREDPRQRAIAVWLGASVLLGAGAFIATVAAPLTFGYDPLILENYAFSFFLLIYIGLAVGLARYRLFELGGWAYQILFYVSAAILLLVLDVAIISLLTLEPGTALGLSLFLVALAYLPARDFFWRRLSRGRRHTEADLFQNVVAAALQPGTDQRAGRWRALLKEHFRPLELTGLAGAGPVALGIGDEGLSMTVPPVADSPALVMRYPYDGHALFSSRDLSIAEQMVVLMQHAEASRGEYDRGVSEERTRIARDIHDNIGAQLMMALHSEGTGRKDDMIRDTLADLRDVINNAENALLPLDDMLADLRSETADRLDPHGLSLDWSVDAMGGVTLSAPMIHTLRSLVREAVSNTIKHAKAKNVSIALTLDANMLDLIARDDGVGFDRDTASRGHGLVNMASRVESFDGRLTISGDADGTQIKVSLPVGRERT
jgi:signal transduction histidine kinase